MSTTLNLLEFCRSLVDGEGGNPWNQGIWRMAGTKSAQRCGVTTCATYTKTLLVTASPLKQSCNHPCPPPQALWCPAYETFTPRCPLAQQPVLISASLSKLR